MTSQLPEAKETFSDPIDFPSWLAAQDMYPKLYIKCRNKDLEIAALGSIKTFSFIPKTPVEDQIRLFGYIPFPSSQQDPCWEDFSSSPFFFLPQIEVHQTPQSTKIFTRGSPISFQKNSPFIGNDLHVKHLINNPCKETWNLSVDTVLQLIARGEIQKAVLARKSLFETDTPLFLWLQKLLDNATKNTTVFALQKSPSSVFLGASPEMLYERKGKTLYTESIAGTRKKGNSLLEEHEQGTELLSSLKDGREVLHVKEFLCQALSYLCKKFSYDETTTLIQTSHLQHLFCQLQGTLQDKIEDKDILEALHPTPAVAGLPYQKAIETIANLEPFDRGLYAGTLGWMSENDSSFCVAIRSALAFENCLHTFSGTGIVEGSIAEKEWQELDDKISHWKSRDVCTI